MSYHHLLTPDLLHEARRNARRRHVHSFQDGITLKFGQGVTKEEYDILQLVHSTGCTFSPVPLEWSTYQECNVIAMTTLPGLPYGHKRIYPGDKESICGDLKRIMDDLNDSLDAMGIRPPYPDQVCSLEGSSCLRLPYFDELGPGPVALEHLVENMTCRTPQLDSLKDRHESILRMLQTDRGVRFCHMDLHPGNILVEGGKVTGIADWEYAGWYTATMEVFAAVCHSHRLRAFASVLISTWGLSSELDNDAQESMSKLYQGTMRAQRENIRAEMVEKMRLRKLIRQEAKRLRQVNETQ
ncbi:hypothetical protein M231_06262 [Tremella mesenterica]|uniref:Aminoglycoside phosphotransferase domain-containing protein n=1 Tax=Tremella mesenterica TaxID=5217 RepID=A0A4Q1BCB3_TREME|nr:uncharacterized protein TREMEDRAFT_65040 [Tremella mesenterica DSM 1558]EIW66657.1 hypothetical protein TREMEDRAFT_65040 [Tremella mesenterica DSM 1558]RXK36478.1 hypothetical protein M231_06262 [Tremella mesenterica]